MEAYELTASQAATLMAKGELGAEELGALKSSEQASDETDCSCSIR